MVDIRRQEYERRWREEKRRKELSGPSVTGPSLLVAAIGSRPAWRDKAACRGMDPDLFYPSRGDNVIMPKKVCADCPVKAECLQDALENNEKHGVWGGKSERERRVMRRTRPKKTHWEHGDINAYQNHGCRCPECRLAYRLYNASRRPKKRSVAL